MIRLYGTIIMAWAKALWATADGKNFPSFSFGGFMRELSWGILIGLVSYDMKKEH